MYSIINGYHSGQEIIEHLHQFIKFFGHIVLDLETETTPLFNSIIISIPCTYYTLFCDKYLPNYVDLHISVGVV